MSYGLEYIKTDIGKLARLGVPKSEALEIISRRINFRYPDIPLYRAKRIVSKTMVGKETTRSDWKTSKTIRRVAGISEIEHDCREYGLPRM